MGSLREDGTHQALSGKQMPSLFSNGTVGEAEVGVAHPEPPPGPPEPTLGPPESPQNHPRITPESPTGPSEPYI